MPCIAKQTFRHLRDVLGKTVVKAKTKNDKKIGGAGLSGEENLGVLTIDKKCAIATIAAFHLFILWSNPAPGQ